MIRWLTEPMWRLIALIVSAMLLAGTWLWRAARRAGTEAWR